MDYQTWVKTIRKSCKLKHYNLYLIACRAKRDSWSEWDNKICRFRECPHANGKEPEPTNKEKGIFKKPTVKQMKAVAELIRKEEK